MTWQLIDGVVANDAFATPATPGTSSLVDGINNQAFAAAASATNQPVDGVLGLTTWTFSGGGAVNYTLSGVAGAYAATGRSGTFKQGHTLAGSAGSYAVVGQAATFKSAHSLSGASGSHSLTGNAATLAYTPGAGSVAYTLSGTAGSYAVAGRAASFTVNRSFTGAAGSYTLTGNAGALSYTPGAGAVNYALTGDAGSYAVTGQQALFDHSGQLSDTHDGWWAKQHAKAKKPKKTEQQKAIEQAEQFIEAATLAAINATPIQEDDDLELLMMML